MRYPFIKQKDMKDCGVSCLLMLTRYYGGAVSTEYLRDLTNTTLIGTSAYNLLEGAKKIGFDGIGVKGDILKLKKSDLPCIAHVVIKKKYEHFIVIYKIDKNKNKLTIADPNNNHLSKLTIEEFNNISTNQFLLLKPKKKIMYVEENKEIKSFFINKLYKNKNSLLSIMLLSFLLIFLQILLSFDFKFILDKSITYFSINNLISLFFIFLIIIILKEISNYTRNKVINVLNHDLDISMFYKVYNHILSLPYLYYKNRTTGEIVSRISDLNNIRNLISKCIVSVIIDSILISLSIATLLIISFKLTLVVLVIIFILSALILIFNKPINDYISDAKINGGYVNSYLVETINGIETIKNQNIVAFIKKKFLLKYAKYNQSSYNYNNLFIIFEFIKNLFIEIGNLIILVLGGYLVIKNELSIGSLITFITLNNYVFSPINSFTDIFLSFKEAKISYERIVELYEIEEEKDNKKYSEILGNISIDDLKFSYNNRDLFLKNININIKKGEKILIYGNSGSGKSTLAKLLSGELKASNKSVYYDGKDINKYSISNLRKDICYVSSKDTLFTDSVYNNIVLDKEDNNFDKAVRICLVDEFIENRNLAYDFLLEEDGFNLSGGQKQRIILARSILKNSNIYILDEALNQVDIYKERTILENLFKSYPNKTFIYISHRFNNNDLFDKKYKIENGVSYEESI